MLRYIKKIKSSDSCRKRNVVNPLEQKSETTKPKSSAAPAATPPKPLPPVYDYIFNVMKRELDSTKTKTN